MTTIKTLYGIIFFVIWAAVGWIKERVISPNERQTLKVERLTT